MHEHASSPPDGPRRPAVVLAGVPLDNITARELLDRMVTDLKGRRGGWIITVNLDILRRLCVSPEYAALCAPAPPRPGGGAPPRSPPPPACAARPWSSASRAPT